MINPIPLPYAYNALEPYYDEETLKIHYDKLYKGYVDNLNKTQEELEKARKNRAFENIKCLEKNLSYNGSGVILHELFFTNLTPMDAKTEPSLELFSQINRDFGNFDDFKKQFIAASTNVEASRMVFAGMDSKI